MPKLSPGLYDLRVSRDVQAELAQLDNRSARRGVSSIVPAPKPLWSTPKFLLVALAVELVNPGRHGDPTA
jgi:hypothetical protein